MLSLRAQWSSVRGRLAATRLPHQTQLLQPTTNSAQAAVRRFTASGTSTTAASTTSVAAPSPPSSKNRRASTVPPPLPPLVRRLYKSLLRVGHEFDRLPALKAAMQHPGIVSIHESASEQEAQWMLSRHEAIAAITRRDGDPSRREASQAAGLKTSSELAKGGKKKTNLSSDIAVVSSAILEELQRFAPKDDADALSQSSAARDADAREFTRLLMEYHARRTSQPFPADADPDDLEATFESRARERFRVRAHGPDAPLADRFYWRWMDRFFRRRRTEYTLDTPRGATLLTGNVDTIPSSVDPAAVDIAEPVAPPQPPQDAAAEVAPTTAATDAPQTIAVASKPRTPLYSSLSPHDPVGTLTPDRYMPTASIAAHIRREFRTVTRTPTPKQYEAMTAALFRVLQYLNGERLTADGVNAEATPTEVDRAHTWMRRLLFDTLPAPLVARDPALIYDPVPRNLDAIRKPATDPHAFIVADLHERPRILDNQWEADVEAIVAQEAATHKNAPAAITDGHNEPQSSTASAPIIDASSSSSLAPTAAPSRPPVPLLAPMPPHWSLRSSRHLRVGSVLASHPQLGEGDFLQSVILLTKVSEEDDLVEGVILNQPWRPEEENEDEHEHDDNATDAETQFEAEISRIKESQAKALEDVTGTKVDVDASITDPAELATEADHTAEKEEDGPVEDAPATADAAVDGEVVQLDKDTADKPPADDVDDAAADEWGEFGFDSADRMHAHLGALIHRFPGVAMYGGPVNYDDDDAHQSLTVLHRRKDWALVERGLAHASEAVSAAHLHPILPAQVELTPDGGAREIVPAVFIGGESHWAEILDWITEDRMEQKWTRRGRDLLAGRSNTPRDADEQEKETNEVTSDPTIAPTSTAADTSAVAVTPEVSASAASASASASVLHSWDFQVYHGRMQWSLRELAGQLDAGDWFVYEGSATHVFTGIVPPEQVAARTREAQRRTVRRFERQHALRSRRPKRRRSIASSSASLSPHMPDLRSSHVPFELFSSPAVSQRTYAAVVHKLADATGLRIDDANPAAHDTAAIVSAATAHLPHVLFPQQRLWNHAMYQLQGDGRHWAYLPNVSLGGHHDEQQEEDEEEDRDEDDGDDDDNDHHDDDDRNH